MLRYIRYRLPLTVRSFWGLFAGFMLVLSMGTSQTALSERYIVLFDQTALSGQSHHKTMVNLKELARKNIARLKAEAKTSGATFELSHNLWFISAAAISAAKKDRAILAKQGHVSAIIADKDRQLLDPPAMGPRLDPDPEQPSWAIPYLGVDTLRRERPELSGAGITVGVLDTGIQDRHPEFDLHSSRTVFKDFVNGLRYAYDDNGHGTHVAGIISGKSMGVAPAVSLVAGKIIAAEGYSRDSWALAGMQWLFDPDGNPATDDYPRIVNNSWGIPQPDGLVYSYPFEPYVRAIKVWVNTGIVPVFATGNKGRPQPDFPAAMLETIAVGGVNQKAELAAFSNYGPVTWVTYSNMFTVAKPDVTAPATAIKSAMINNIYAEQSGTSMAAPFVTGSLALLFQDNPRYDTLEAKLMLYHSVRPKRDRYHGFGILNTYDLVTKSAKLNAKPRGLRAPASRQGAAR